MKGSRKFGLGKLGNIFKKYFIVTNKDSSIVTILDENDVAVPDVFIQIKRGSYTYVDVTDENGNVELKGAYNKRYEVTLAKSQIEQKVINNWVFTNTCNITYEQIPKVNWDGMYSDTDERMYVDTQDGGNLS